MYEIGSSVEIKLLTKISKQLKRLIQVAGSNTPTTTTTTTTTP